MPIATWPLCQRRDDISLLVDHFLHLSGERYRRVADGPKPWRTMDALLAYAFRTIPELQKLVELDVPFHRFWRTD